MIDTCGSGSSARSRLELFSAGCSFFAWDDLLHDRFDERARSTLSDIQTRQRLLLPWPRQHTIAHTRSDTTSVSIYESAFWHIDFAILDKREAAFLQLIASTTKTFLHPSAYGSASTSSPVEMVVRFSRTRVGYRIKTTIGLFHISTCLKEVPSLRITRTSHLTTFSFIEPQ